MVRTSTNVIEERFARDTPIKRMASASKDKDRGFVFSDRPLARWLLLFRFLVAKQGQVQHFDWNLRVQRDVDGPRL